jgi:AraC-like DNA-binding protein
MTLTSDLYKRIIAAKVFIDENFQDMIDLDQVARKALISKFHFHRIFKQVYHKTPHQYLTYKRIEAAKVMLSREGIPVADICNRIGYESLSSFSTLFRKQSGYTPQYYRNVAWLKKRLSAEQPKRFIPHCFFEQYKLGDDKSE